MNTVAPSMVPALWRTVVDDSPSNRDFLLPFDVSDAHVPIKESQSQVKPIWTPLCREDLGVDLERTEVVGLARRRFNRINAVILIAQRSQYFYTWSASREKQIILSFTCTQTTINHIQIAPCVL